MSAEYTQFTVGQTDWEETAHKWTQIKIEWVLDDVPTFKHPTFHE